MNSIDQRGRPPLMAHSKEKIDCVGYILLYALPDAEHKAKISPEEDFRFLG